MLRVTSVIYVLALVACVDEGDEGMYVLNNTAPTGATCSLGGTPDQAFLSHGSIFAQSPLGYLLTPLIQSRIAPDTMTTMPDPAQKTIQLRGADVTLTLKAVSIEQGGAFTVTQPETMVGQFGVLFSGAVLPGGSVNVGFDVIPPATLRNIVAMSGANLSTDRLDAEVLASVTIRGEISGSEVLSSPFLYPITVCNECIVANLGACPLMIMTARSGNPCNPFQDGIVDCCSDVSGSLICPGPTM